MSYIDEEYEHYNALMRIQSRQRMLTLERLDFLNRQLEWEAMEREGTADPRSMRAFFGLPPLTEEQIAARNRAVYAHEVKW